jgi:hypothetical protein
MKWAIVMISVRTNECKKHFRSNPLPANNAANALRIESDLERRETNTMKILWKSSYYENNCSSYFKFAINNYKTQVVGILS